MIGVILIVKPVLPSIGPGAASYVVALLGLISPVWLAVFDHVATRARPDLTDTRQLLRTCACAGASVAAIYALGAPFRLQHVVGVQLPPAALVEGIGSSLAAHIFVFMAMFLALVAVGAAARATRRGAAIEYALLVGVVAAVVAAIVYALVFESIAFVRLDAVVAAVAIGAALALSWSGMARWHASAANEEHWTTLGLFLAPITGRASPTTAAVVLTGLPMAAYTLTRATEGTDWNFVVQKIGALTIWLVAFAMMSRVLRPGCWRPARVPLALPPTLALAVFVGVDLSTVGRLEVADRYATVDISFRLIRDLRVEHDRETTDFYAYLKAHTLVPPAGVVLAKTAFVPATGPPSDPPDIFLFLVDSLRRDYLAPYNDAVGFTPSIAKFASTSFVFDRAFTRYAGTSMAVPSIWAGGMLMHMFDLAPFDGRNALLNLLQRSGYRRVMDIDHIMRELLPADDDVVELDRGVAPMLCDLCRTLRELEDKLTVGGDHRPVFAYTLSQNVHISVANLHKVPEGRAYPGFYAPVADSVHEVDACFGSFISFLERSGRYDNSIVILTSDHGDSLGEEGRFGHSYFMVPEVMRVPLLVHLPASMRAQVRTDLDRVSFSTDITPTLYALVGNPPADVGPLFGRPLFALGDQQLSDRRRDSFLLASSYGAVYGMLRHNGRQLYAADAIDSREARYDMTGDGPGRKLLLTEATSALNRRFISGELDRLAALNHFTPHP